MRAPRPGSGQRNMPRAAWEAFRPEATTTSGYALMRDLHTNLDRFPLKSKHQVRFLEAFTSASSVIIYGDDYTPRRVACDWPQYDDTRNVVMVTAARRMGKTVAVQMFSLAFILSIPNTVVAIYAPGMRTANKLLEGITALFREHAAEEMSVVKCNATEFRIRPRGAPISDTRTVFCYPSNIVSSFFKIRTRTL